MGIPSMARPPPPKPAEPDLSFREAVGPVRPLKVTHTHVLPTPSRTHRRAPKAGVLTETRGIRPTDHFTQVGTDRHFHRATVSARTLSQLRRGQWRIEADIDLHGLTSLAAEATLRRHLSACLHQGHRCIRVIHGKGHGSGALGPVLKDTVAYWLCHWDAVEAFTSARPRDGGSGAL